MLKNCLMKWKNAINLRNGLQFSELAKPKIINIPLHALTKITQLSFTVWIQFKELEFVTACHQDRARKERENNS